jgi:Zn-dependent peptidase ImmA (M78 family)
MPIKKAKEILAEYWDSILPVSPKKIAEKLGISVRAVNNSEPYSGKAFLENTTKIIEFKESEPILRQRFTIAHELAHHMLGHTADGHKFRDNIAQFSLRSSEPFEIQANKFAAELLMPKEAIDYLIMDENITSLNQLAELFAVSTVAMQYRLNNLGWLK